MKHSGGAHPLPIGHGASAEQEKGVGVKAFGVRRCDFRTISETNYGGCELSISNDTRYWRYALKVCISALIATILSVSDETWLIW